MKIELIGEVKVIMSNPESRHRYFAWPTVARLQNGKLAVVASGFRLKHICPFGKTVISYSEDEGETYTLPAAVIDTVLDDRDGGILAFGERSVIVTSFNNKVEMQRRRKQDNTPYSDAYLDLLTPEEEEAAFGSTFRISHDCGVTFGPIHKSPVTSPHGPLALPDGDLLWLGSTLNCTRIEAHRIKADGSMEKVGDVPPIEFDGTVSSVSEPYAFLLEDGSIIGHIRVGTPLSIYQTKSYDMGKTWTTPKAITTPAGGAPSHIMRHSSGVLIASIGFRGEPSATPPFGVRILFSHDNGEHWSEPQMLYSTEETTDLGYPSTVELQDGSLLTVFYARPERKAAAVIMQQKWRIKE